jgi:hypothetical protein
MSRYAKLSVGLIAAWLSFSVIASALHLYQNGPDQPPLALGLAVITPIIAFLLWFAVSAPFRQFALSLNPRALTFVQSWRVAGFVFLVLAAYAILPRAFALPAGWGDITIGATASLVGWKLASAEHRKSFMLWQALGIADLVMAVSLGTLVSILDPHGIPTSPMTVLPLSLIPTFAVPLLLILHVICIALARRWPKRRAAPLGAQVRSQTA